MCRTSRSYPFRMQAYGSHTHSHNQRYGDPRYDAPRYDAPRTNRMPRGIFFPDQSWFIK